MIFRDWNDNEVEKPDDREIIWRPSAYAIIIDDNKILLVKSKGNGKFTLPGGEVNLNETLLEGLAREVYEETGCSIDKESARQVHTGENFFYAEDVDVYSHALLTVYELDLLGSDRKIDIGDNEEVEDVLWIPLNNLLTEDINKMTLSLLKGAGVIG